MKRWTAILLLLTTVGFAQNPVKASLDTTRNKIGAQFNLTLKAVADTAQRVKFPSGKNFGALEVIRNYVPDTIKKGAQYELVKRYGLTQFDSGRYVIPPLKVIIGKKEFLTDSLKVEVANVKVDTLKQKLYDIRGIIEPKAEPVPWWAYLLLLICLAALAWAIIKIVKRPGKQRPAEEVFKTPIERATGLLRELEQKHLIEKGEIKSYYSELTDIARSYIEEAIHIPAMESTTSELIDGLRLAAARQKLTLNPETVENLEKVLRQADLVKFAKSKPLDFEIAEDRKRIEASIVKIDSAIPDEVDEEEADALRTSEALRQQFLKKQRRRKTLNIIGFAVGFIVAFFIGLVITKGFTFVKDVVIGSQTKSLLKGEWVKSDYGNPAVSIETPQVLRRQDVEKYLPKGSAAIIKDSQLFAEGNYFSKFTAMVFTLTYKSEQQVDLHQAMDAVIHTMEMQGAQNIIVKQEDYSTKSGITGVKAYGTLTMLDPVSKSSSKMYYEVLLFGQQNGLQQITVMHEEGDQAGEKITDRILNSVELKVNQP